MAAALISVVLLCVVLTLQLQLHVAGEFILIINFIMACHKCWEVVIVNSTYT